MVYSVTDPSLKLNVEPAALKQLNSVAPNTLQAISQVLASGKVLDVIINQHKKSGQRGIYLFGQFIPATVPESLRNGERVSVKVSDVGESLILKIVGKDLIPTEQKTSSALSDIVQHETLTQLREATRTLSNSTAPNILKSLEQLEQLPIEMKTTASDLRQLLASLTQQHEVIAEQEIQDPQLLQRALIAITGHDSNLSRRYRLQNSKESIARVLDRLIENIALCKDKSAVEGMLTTLTDAHQSVRALKDTLETKELMSNLSLIMGSLGESSLLVMPTIVNGAVVSWEMVVAQDQPSSSYSFPESEPSESPPPYQHLQLFLLFDSIGAVKVEIAHRSQETLIRFTVADSDGARFLESKCGALQERLSSKGDLNLVITTEHDATNNILPSWLHALLTFHTRV